MTQTVLVSKCAEEVRVGDVIMELPAGTVGMNTYGNKRMIRGDVRVCMIRRCGYEVIRLFLDDSVQDNLIGGWVVNIHKHSMVVIEELA